MRRAVIEQQIEVLEGKIAFFSYHLPRIAAHKPETIENFTRNLEGCKRGLRWWQQELAFSREKQDDKRKPK